MGCGASTAAAGDVKTAAVAPLRVVPAMNAPEEVKPAPKSGWTLTMAGGARTVDDVWASQEKAAKKYMSGAGKDGESDIKAYEKGWTTK